MTKHVSESEAAIAEVAASSPAAAQAVSDINGAIKDAAEDKARLDGIAILGSNPATVGLAPFGDPRWLIYACSPHNIEQRILPRVNQWFEVHLPVTHPTRQYHYLRQVENNVVASNPPHCEVIWARDQQFIARCRDARPYPENEMKSIFGPFTFTSSIAYMMAKAIVDAEQLGVTKIGLWGIMQASENEYAYQRPGIQNLIWEATKRKIQVLAPKESMLFEPPPENW